LRMRAGFLLGGRTHKVDGGSVSGDNERGRNATVSD
jgi:hypothetical protein